MKGKCYPYRAGTFKSTLEMLKYNSEIAAMLGNDPVKLSKFDAIIDKNLAEAEERCKEYEEER